jgi:hypothetical protein
MELREQKAFLAMDWTIADSPDSRRRGLILPLAEILGEYGLRLDHFAADETFDHSSLVQRVRGSNLVIADCTEPSFLVGMAIEIALGFPQFRLEPRDRHDVYIGGALTGIGKPEHQKSFYGEIGGICTALGRSAYVPHLFTDPIRHPGETPEDVYIIDHSKIACAELAIFYGDPFSLGVGEEFEIALKHGVHTILVYPGSQPMPQAVLTIPGLETYCVKDRFEAVQTLRTAIPKFFEGERPQKTPKSKAELGRGGEVIIIHEESIKVSRMARGNPAVMETIPYSSPDKLQELMRPYLQNRFN